MKIGDLLLAAKLVTAEQISAARSRQIDGGGRLGANLVAIGAIDQDSLDRFLAGIPSEPLAITGSGVDDKFLIDLLLKIVFVGPHDTVADLSHAIKLPPKIVADLLDAGVRGQLVTLLGSGASVTAGMRYELTDAGKKRAIEASAKSSYAGPAPVSIDAYTDRIRAQKTTNEHIDWKGMQDAFADLQIAEAFVDQIGPAITSGRALLMYGPPGNGKTSIAQRLDKVFKNVIYIPYAVLIDGQVMRVFDADVHRPVDPEGYDRPEIAASLHRDNADARWVACWRPFIITGGELTLEMLDLKHEPLANFYVAPLHIKAAGGCLLIDDFGRQIVSPTALLNRWIVPLENRVDYLKLHTGKSFRVPFEAIVIFSTNLEPADLMDPAFLRRIPYKLEICAPAQQTYRRIFESVAAANGLRDKLTDDIFGYFIRELTDTHGLALAAFQPRFLIDQIVSACRFRNIPLDFHPDLIDYAIGNLTVGRAAARAPTLAKVA
jgi:hypothetical protein